MLLAVDVGNTETVLGLFEDQRLVHHWRLTTREERTADESALALRGLLAEAGLAERDVTGVVIGSVVPGQTQALRDMAHRYLSAPPLVVEAGVRTGVAVLYENPRDVGADRIANAAAAHHRFGGPAVVVDFGTATTFDIVSGSAEYLGGVIFPGVKISATALFRAAARLPRVEVVPPRSVVARTTVESVQAGLVFGTAAMVDGLVARIEEQVGECTVVATGGLAEPVVGACASVDHHEPWLTLEGLRLIHERNAERRAP